MNRLIFYGLVAMLVVLSMSACVYNNEEALYPHTTPPDSCGITTVSYANQVVPILQTECYGCHSQQNAPFSGNSIVLEGYANVKNYADNGRLKGAINHDATFSPMPQGGGKLPVCTLTTINKWIEAGALDN